MRVGADFAAPGSKLPSNSPHRAQIVVQASATEKLPGLIRGIRALKDSPALASAELVVSPLRQGPSITAPIEIRVSDASLEELVAAAQDVREALANVVGVVEVRTDASLGAPVVTVDIDAAAAARAAVSPEQISATLRAHTLGARVGEIRTGPDPIPIVVGGVGERTPEQLMGATLRTPAGSLPIAALAELGIRWRPAIVRHRNRARVVSVLASLAPGYRASGLRTQLEAAVRAVESRHAVTISFGGESEESAKANQSLGRAAPLGAIVLVGILVATFNSLRRTAIVLVTVPLSIAGIVPGLLLGGQPFGFMALLGVIALVGIVVNNAIVLIDKIDRLQRSGVAPDLAVHVAVQTRTRPILLTTITTVVGLVPLAFSSSRLWPPLAWPMMTGLVASTALTLLVTPALVRLTLRPGTKQQEGTR